MNRRGFLKIVGAAVIAPVIGQSTKMATMSLEPGIGKTGFALAHNDAVDATAFMVQSLPGRLQGRSANFVIHDEFCFVTEGEMDAIRLTAENRKAWKLYNFAKNYGCGPKRLKELEPLNYSELEAKVIATEFWKGFNNEELRKLFKKQGVFLPRHSKPMRRLATGRKTSPVYNYGQGLRG